MNKDFEREIQVLEDNIRTFDERMVFLDRTIQFLDEETFNELNEVIESMEAGIHIEDATLPQKYVTLSVATLGYNIGSVKKFRYKVFTTSKQNIRYRYFLRICFKYFFHFRGKITAKATMEKIFRLYDPSHEGYKEMKQMMLIYKLENKGGK